MMRWQYKAALQGLFSVVPGGHEANFAFQRFISHSWPLADDKLVWVVDCGRRYLETYERLTGNPASSARLYEFGAGAELSMPLVQFSLGVTSQTLVDIRRLVRRELVQSTADSIARLRPEVELQRAPGSWAPSMTLSAYLSDHGVRYFAPCDARATGLPSASADLVTSTNTLEHIPKRDILSILNESRRLLAADGLIICRIDYQDHYSYFDRSISVYNFLQYSDRRWRFLSPSLQFQNRLRHSDYIQLFQDAGWQILDDGRDDVHAEDLVVLKSIALDDRFSRYDLEDLAVRGSLIVAKPQR